MAQYERRRHPRLAICLPVSHRPADGQGLDDPPAERHDVTIDVAPGGVYFSMAGQAPAVGSKLHMELTVPPGEGHFPYPGRIRGLGTVLRCRQVSDTPPGRWVVAARFDEPLALDFH